MPILHRNSRQSNLLIVSEEPSEVNPEVCPLNRGQQKFTPSNSDEDFLVFSTPRTWGKERAEMGGAFRKIWESAHPPLWLPGSGSDLIEEVCLSDNLCCRRDKARLSLARRGRQRVRLTRAGLLTSRPESAQSSRPVAAELGDRPGRWPRAPRRHRRRGGRWRRSGGSASRVRR